MFRAGLQAAPAGPPALPFPADWPDLVPELHRQASDYLVTKQRVGAFIGTSLDQYLRQRGVTQVVLAGISTSAGVNPRAAAPTTSGTT